MRLAILFIFLATWARAQTNLGTANLTGNVSNSPAVAVQPDSTNFPSREQLRAECINGRRSICGRIIKILPDALIVECGYTNLMRHPLDLSWLVPGTATASRATDLVESGEPGSVCVGLVCLTDYPKSRRLKPKLYDYVIIQGYPAGEYTYTSVGEVHRTVRRFSASISAAINLNLQLLNARKAAENSK